MEDEIIVKYEVNREQIGHMWGAAARSWRFKVIGPVIVIIATAIIFFGDMSAPLADQAVDLVKGVFVMSLFYFLLLFVQRWQFMRQFKKSPIWGVDREWKITPERLIHEAGQGAMFRGDFAWAAIVKIVEERHGFMLYTSTRSFQWLPYSGFENEGEIAKFREMARAAGVKMK